MSLSSQGRREINITGVSFLVSLVSMVALFIVIPIFNEINFVMVLAIVATSMIAGACAHTALYARAETGVFSYYAYFTSIALLLLTLTNIYMLVTGDFSLQSVRKFL